MAPEIPVFWRGQHLWHSQPGENPCSPTVHPPFVEERRFFCCRNLREFLGSFRGIPSNFSYIIPDAHV